MLSKTSLSLWTDSTSLPIVDAGENDYWYLLANLLSYSIWATTKNYPKLDGFNNQHLFLKFLEVEKSEIKAQDDLVSAEAWL